MADREVTVEDILALEQEAPVRASPEQLPAAPQRVHKEGPGFVNTAKAIIDNEWAAGAIGRIAADSGIAFDPEWDLSQIPEEEFQALTDGLSDDVIQRISESARSGVHFHTLVGDARRVEENERVIAEAGGWGVAGTVVGTMVDPAGVLLAMSTGGLGVAGKADRLRRLATNTQTFEQRRRAVQGLDAVAKGTGTRAALTVGAVAAAENAALEAVLVEGDVTRDGWDVAFASLAGFGIGGLYGKVLSGGERRLAREWADGARRQLEADEFAHEIAKRRDEIVARLGDVDAARATSGEPVARAAEFLAERSVDPAGYDRFLRALESGGVADAANPQSSAVGIDQFTKPTWLALVRRSKPKWAEGLGEDEILALRTDPAKSGEMRTLLDADNAKALQRANAPVNHFTLYAAHHFGERRGVRFALAPNDTRMEDILSPGQLNANAYLKGKTKGEALANWAERARRAGALDLEGAVQTAGRSTAETLAATRRASIDVDATQARLAELDTEVSTYDAQIAQLQQEAQGAIPSGELRKLQRKVDKLERDLRHHRGEPSAASKAKLDALDEQLSKIDELAETLRARFLDEDVAKLGREVATNKQRSKLRESAVKRAAKEERKRLETARRKVSHDYRSRRYSVKEQLREPKARLEAGLRADAAGRSLKELLRADPRPRATAEGAQLREALGLAQRLDEGLKTAEARPREITDYLKATQSTRADLDKLDGMDSLQRTADARKDALRTGMDAPAFGADSLSAARAMGFDPGLYPSLEEIVDSATASKMKFGDVLNLWGAGTFSGLFRGSDNAVVRKYLGPLVGNPLGNADDSVVEVGASEVSSRLLRAWVGKFNTAINAPYDEWLKEVRPGNRYRRAVRADFMRQLGLHIRGNDTDSEAIKKAAAGVRKVFAEIAEEAKAAGVQGFENVSTDANWLPRVFDFNALYGLRQKHGADAIELLFEGAIRQVSPDIDDALVKRIAKAYVTRMSELRMGNDANLMQGMVFNDVVFLRQFLEEATVKEGDTLAKAFTKAEIEQVVDQFAGAKLSGGADALSKEGSFRHAKARLKFDENYGANLLDLKSPTAERVPVHIHQFFENNVEQLFGRYVRTMAGHIGLAKVGIRGSADWQERMKIVARALENDPKQWENIEKKANLAYNILTARPIDDGGLLNELGRTGREIAFATQMENVGLSNVPDLATLFAWGNFRYTRQAFFDGTVFGALWKRGMDGRMHDDLSREIEEVWGLGTDYLNNTVFTAYDISEEHAEALVTGKAVPRALSKAMSNVGHGARVASRAVTAGSGLGAITAGAQRLAANVMIHRIKDDVFKGGRISDARSAALGLDKAMKGRIEKQMKAHTAWVKGDTGGRIQRIGFEKWDDTEARDAFMYAVLREAKKNVQEEDLGDTIWWQHKGWGKVISQFRRFAMTAWTKQTLRGLAERDVETITRAGLQFVMAAGVWEARHQLAALGMEAAGVDPEKVEKYREDRLAPDRIVAAGIRNSGVASLLPDAYDTVAGRVLGETFFDVRNSSNASDLIGGIPLVGLVNSMGNAAAGTAQAALRGDKQFTKNDARAWQAMVPFGHHILVQPFFEALTADLPDADADDDPDSIDWF